MEHYFKDNQHKKTFMDYIVRFNAHKDREYKAALYLLAATGKDMDKYFDDGIVFIDLLETAGAWSSGERALATMAANLFNSSYYKADIDEVFYSLDADFLKIAIEALMIRYK